jgi:NCAIR mutase (PurE)-related protein
LSQGTPAEVDLGYARVDLDRLRRQGAAEVIFGQGKSAAEIAGVARALFAAGQRALATRVEPAVAAEVVALLADLPVRHAAAARCVVVESAPAPEVGRGEILVLTAGTTDGPVAAEVVVTTTFLGHRTRRIDDVGVAGLHRLLAHLDALRAAEVIVVVAGMEAALASVVGGLVACPVIAVPTSVGYGASFGGLAALLGLLNACAAGITVVNIDNGFGAGCAAARINALAVNAARREHASR